MSQEILNKKNIEAIHQNQKIIQEKLGKVEEENAHLRTSLMDITLQLQQVQQKVNIFMATSRGSGSTAH